MGRTAPVVSVLLPARNVARYLDAALDSLARQTFRDFEVIVIDDGSTDQTAEVAAAWGRRDARFRLRRSTGEGGIGAALADGTADARGAFIARMDGDDCSRPRRFAEQLRFLNQNPNVGGCGAWARTFGSRSHQTWRPAADPDRVQAATFFDAPVLHPTVMVRRAALVEAGGYCAAMPRAEDFELWTRFVRYRRLTNLPKVLLDYRLHDAQATAGIEQHHCANQVRSRLLREWWPDCAPEAEAFHLALCARTVSPTWPQLSQAEQWLRSLLRRIDPPLGASPKAWAETLAVRWLEACRLFLPLGPRMIGAYVASPLRRTGAVELRRELRLVWDVMRQGARPSSRS